MKKAINIYSNILVNQPAIARLLQHDKKIVLDQYQNYTRRLHCNLQVLTFIHEKYHIDIPAQKTSKTPFPIIVQAPADMPELNNLYNKLQELYPEAVQFIKAKVQQMKTDQRPGASQRSSMSSPAMAMGQGQGQAQQGQGQGPTQSQMSQMNQNMSQGQTPMSQGQTPMNPGPAPAQAQVHAGQMSQMSPQMSQMNPMSQQSMPQLSMPQLSMSQQPMGQMGQMGQMSQMAPLSAGSPAQNSPAQFQYKNMSMNNNFINNPQLQPSLGPGPTISPQQQHQPAPQSISPQQLYQSINPGSPGNMLDFFN